jgi:SAM-dependent methyltransferase
MAFFDLLRADTKVVRDIAARRANKERNRALARKFDVEYFDGARETGYGGYRYDGRWVAVARRLAARYALKPGDRVLDLGCAKGFLMHDLATVVPGLEIWGLDISAYAITNAHGDTRRRMVRGDCAALPFADGAFACAVAINTIHNLELEGCLSALREIERVAPGRGFVQVDAYRGPDERQAFVDWMLTARTYLTPEGWLALFARAGYTGDHYWTILRTDGSLG